jgi:ABC-2 type transport system permease protein
MNPMELDVQILWKQRFERYAKETIGYWQYAARSNFIGFSLFLVIVSSYYYAKTLQHLPTSYPYIWITVLVLVPLLVWSPIRTLLKEPDRMFLLRVELQMGAYFRGGFLYSLFMQSFFSFLALTVLWPLYRHCAGDASQPFLFVLGFLLILKTASLQASWRESQFVLTQARFLSALYRWIAAFVIIYLLFLHSPLEAGTATFIFICVWLAAFRQISRYRVGWEYLIDKEKQQQGRLYAFFNWFVDVPHLPTRIRRRSWISEITGTFPFASDSTYLYLYTKTLLRTELFGMVERITFIGALAIFVLSSDAARTVVFLAVLLITTVQLSTLGQAHRYTFWLEMYPLDKSLKPASLAWIVWTTLFVQTIVLAIPLVIRAPWIYALVPLVCALLSSFICGVILRRKFVDE